MPAPLVAAPRSMPRARRSVSRRHPLRRFMVLERLEDRTVPNGAGAHPTYIIFHPTGTAAGAAEADAASSWTIPAGSTTPLASAFAPATIREAYDINLLSGDGSGSTIAIVDAYDDPNFVNRSTTLPIGSDTAFLKSDLHAFDVQYGLPEPPGFFTKVNQSGGNAYPSTDPAGAGNNNWESEEALDVEWVHALAPGAHIILVEANDNSNNLYTAEQYAGSISGAEVVSNSWGGGDSSSDTSLDSSFAQPAGYGVTYLASTGDGGAPGGYPAFSPDVVAVGGTSLFVNGNGSYNHETGWSGSGGGPSQFELQPTFQKAVVPASMSTVGGVAYRTIPDVSFVADPNTGVSVYDNYNGAVTGGPWFQFGGTSVACPCFAALVGIVDQLRAEAGEKSLSGPGQVLPTLYKIPAGDYHDVTSGNNGYQAVTGYDMVTGIGSPVANKLVADVAGFLYAASSSPADGSSVATPPTSYSITFSNPINPSTVQASAFTVNGIPASGVTVDTSDTVATYTYTTSPVTAQGAQTMNLAVGGVFGLGNTLTNTAFSATFYYDAVPLAVSSTNPASGSVYQLPASSLPFSVTFNEPIDPTLVSTSNLVLSQGTVSSAVVEAGNETVDYTLTGVTNDGNMTVTIPAGTFKDRYDNPTSPSLTTTYFVDNPTQAFPTPLQATGPLGSLVYQGSVSDLIDFVTDVDTYTLTINAGQTITVLDAATGGLQPSVVLTDPASHVLGSATGAAPGQSAYLQTIPTTSAGVYTITVSGAGGSTGSYTLGITLNAALDTATQGGPVNGTLSSAQDIDSSFIALDSGSSRGAVVGSTSFPGNKDYYSFSLNAGDAATLALQDLGASPLSVALEDGSGTTMAASASGPGEELVSDFIASATGTYYAVVAGNFGTSYNLTVTRNADFATGGNETQATAQPLLGTLGGAAHVLGDLNVTTNTITFSELPPQAVNGLSLEGITFGFTVNGLPSTGAEFGGGGPGTTKYTTPPQLSGETDGVLTFTFANPTPILSFGVVLDAIGTVSSGCVVSLYDPSSHLLTTIPVTTSVPPGYTFTEALFSYSGAAAQRAVITFNATAAPLFVVDNVTYSSGTGNELYAVNLAAGAAFQAATTTPSAGPGAFMNTLDPELRLLGSGGTVVAQDDNSASDGRNALLTYTVPGGQGGTYYLEVLPSTLTANPTLGEYAVTLSGLSPSNAVGPFSLPNWTQNLPYNQTIKVSGTSAGLTYSATGTLPSGLSLQSNGTLSGTPTSADSFAFSVTATDATNDTASRAYNVVINPPVAITTTTLPNVPLGVAFGQTISASGGTGTLTFTATGSLPVGLTLTSVGLLSGTPTSTGAFAFTITATDALGAGSSQNFAMHIFGFSPSTLPSYEVDQTGYSQTITVTGGVAPYTFTTTGGLAPGMSLSATGVIAGVPSAAGVYNFTVTATDSVGVMVSEGYALTILPGPVLSRPLTELVNFNYTNGGYPVGDLMADSAGNFFGTTSGGGTFGYGTVFEIPHSSNSLITLANFNSANGSSPAGNLVEDSNGNLFGTAQSGGSFGYGTVFKVSKGSGTITTLATFNNTNGAGPNGHLVLDSNGDLFGATAGGGSNNDGTVFELVKDSGTITTLGSFNSSNGYTVMGGVIEDSNGDLFGTTEYGGAFGDGTVFEVAQGSLSITDLVSFNYNNGAFPLGPLVEDASGNIFGTTNGGGSGYGTVFQVSQNDGSITTLATFNYSTTGAYPEGRLVEDSSGNLFGTTYEGGAGSYGTVFEVSSGSGTPSPLANFIYSNGGYTVAGLVEDSDGNLFGVAEEGGTPGYGTVFEVGTTLPGWTINRPGYTHTFTASGGSGSLSFSLAAGTLPLGLSLASTGILSGTPTALGSSSFTVAVTDSIGATGTQSFTVIIQPPPIIVPGTLPSWTENVPYAQPLVSGGTAPYTFTQGGILPPGLTLSSNGDLTGVPTTFGTYSFTVAATDTTGSSSSGQNVAVTIHAPVQVTTGAAVNWTINQPGYNEAFVATQGTGSKTFAYTGNLPPGLTLSTNGVLTGTPTKLGNYNFTLLAIDSVGGSGSKAFAITINPPVMITTTNTATWTAGYPFIQAIIASGGTGGKGFSAPAASLPPGISILLGGTLIGTPTTAGTYAFTITATDQAGATATQMFTMVVNPPVGVGPASLPNWTINQPGYSQTFSAMGGTGSLTLSKSGTLPAGLTITGGNVLSGTPTALGSYTFSITAKDSLGATSSQSYTVVINPAVALPVLSLPVDTVNIAYNQTITATGGTGALTLTVSNVSGAIAGLNIPTTATGSLAITGTPTAAGTETFTLTASDPLGSTSIQTYAVTVNPGVSITTTNLAKWTDGLAGYSQTITATGGTGSLTFGAATLPPGLTLNSNTGVLSGTPASAGTFSFTVTANDALGASGSQGFGVVINPPVSVAAATLAVWTANLAGYSQSLSATGGTGTLTFSSSGTLPPGLTLSTSGVLSGTPTAGGTYSFMAIATDTLSASGSQTFTVTINPVVTLNPGVLPTGLVNFAYNRTITPSGGTGAVTLAVSSLTGAIPGLTVSGGGTSAVAITGTPTATGTEQFTVTATDTLGYNTAVTYSITINPTTVYLTLPTSGYSGTPGRTILSVPISINELQDQASTNHVGLQSATLALTYPTGVFNFPIGSGKANSDVTLGSVPLSDTVSPGGAADWSFTATAPQDGQLNITLTALSGKKITTDNPANGGSLVLVSFPVSSSYAPTSPTAEAITIVSANGAFHTSIVGNNGTYILVPAPPYAGSVTVNPPFAITTASLPDWTAGLAYQQSIAASGGTGSLTFSATGTLPAGLSLSTTGVLSGTPTVAGSYSFTVTATDSVRANASQSYTVLTSPGPFGQFNIAVVGGSTTVTAGSSFTVAVQAADGYGNPISDYSGPSSVTVTVNGLATDPSQTVAIDNSGLGLSSFTLLQAGNYTITVTAGPITGGPLPITVSAGPAAGLAFVDQPQSTITGVTLQPVSVQVEDLYGNLVTSDSTDTVTVAVASGPGTFTGGSTTSVMVHNGVATFTNLILAAPGSYVLSAIVATRYTGPNSTSFSVAPLEVVPGSFQGTPSGFSLQFNAPYLVNSVTPVLYGHGFGATGTAPSVILTTDPGNLSDTDAYVAGSLVLDQVNNRITFVSTTTANLSLSKLGSGPQSPLLPDGVYTAVVRSSAATDGFQALVSGGGYLDGLGSGHAGSGDFLATFTVNAAAAHDDIVWIPPTAEGPGQPLSAPGKNNVGGGYPIFLSDSTAAVSQVQVTLNYDPTVLNVTGASGAGFTLLAASTPGHAVLQYSGPALATGVDTPIGYVLATVPAGTVADPVPYKKKDFLTLTNVTLNNGSAIPVTTAGALHLVAYVGDADGNGMYSSNDAVLITRALLNTDTGFAAYPLVDPVIAADTDGSGFIPADAALQANEAGVGMPAANLPIPAIPIGVHFQPISNNVDPTLSVDRGPWSVDRSTMTVAVNIDDAHPAGSTGLIEGHLALTYDPEVFTVSAADIRLGTLLAAGSGWSVTPTINSVTGQIAIALASTTPITSTLAGSLVTIDFHQRPGEPGALPGEPGALATGGMATTIALVPSVNPGGSQVITTELEDAQGTFVLSPAPTNGFDSRAQTPVTLSAGVVATQVTSSNEGPELYSRLAEASSIDAANTEVPSTPPAAASAPAAADAPLLPASSIPHGTVVVAAPALEAAMPWTGVVALASTLPLSAPIAPVPHTVDALLQALARWSNSQSDATWVTPISVVYDRFLAAQGARWPLAAENLDSMDWDGIANATLPEMNKSRNARREDKEQVPGPDSAATASNSLTGVDQAALDEYFAEAFQETNQAGASDSWE